MTPVLLDAGPLVALLQPREQHHLWAIGEFAKIEAPLLTCEPVMTEACFLVRELKGGNEAVLGLLARGSVTIPFRLKEEIREVMRLLLRYSDVPMSLADACLVRMAEQYPGARILTLDSHFKIYRKNGREAISTIMPTENPA